MCWAKLLVVSASVTERDVSKHTYAHILRKCHESADTSFTCPIVSVHVSVGDLGFAETLLSSVLSALTSKKKSC